MNANPHLLCPAGRPQRRTSVTLRQFASLCAFALAIFCHRSEAAEFAFVSDESLRLVDDSGAMVIELPRYSVVDVRSRKQDQLIIGYEDQQFQISTAQVYLSSQFPSINADNEEDLRYVVASLVAAEQSQERENYDLAFQMAEQSRKRLDLFTDEPTLFHALIWQFQSSVRYEQQDYDEALRLLTQADNLIAGLNQQTHFVAADGLQLRAFVYEQVGREAESARLYQQAALILLNDLGSRHMDTVTAFSNLAWARFEAEQYAEAFLAQSITVNAIRQLLPADDERCAFETAYLGAVAREAGRYSAALEACAAAAELYETHHPQLQSELYDVYTDVIYIQTETENYDDADLMARQALTLIAQMPAALKRTSVRDLAMRQGRVDFDQGQYADALAHFRTAIAQFDADDPAEDDGSAEEWVGDILVEQERLPEAKQAYERAIDRLAAATDPESDRILDLRKYADDLQSDTDNTLSDIVMVELPQGYLLNDDGSVAHTVPGLTVLDWRQSDDSFHTVVYNGELYRLANTQLRTAQSLPGYALTTPNVFRTLTTGFTDAVTALSKGEGAEADAHMEQTLEFSRREYGNDSSLTLWLELMQIAIHARTRGPSDALDRLDEIQPRLDAVNVNAYDFTIDVNRIKGGCQLDLDNGEKSAQHYRLARDAALEQLGANHAVTINNTRHLAKSLRYSGQHEQALSEFQSALKKTEDIYPATAAERADTVSELSVVLMDLGRLDEAKTLLEGALENGAQLPPEQYLALAASLSRVYLADGDDRSAREVAEAVVEELSPNRLNVIPALMSLQVLSELDLKQERWEDAVKHLTLQIKSLAANGLADNFAAAQASEQLATALTATGDRQQAAQQLREVLRIYEILGGGDSPQADAIRERLSELTSAPDEDPVRDLISRFLDLNPEGESMQIVQQDCPVRTAPAADSRRLAQLTADTQVWSLQQQDGFHRIYLEDQDQYGWVAADSLQSQREIIVTARSAELRTQLKEQSADKVNALLERFQRAIAPSENLDEKTERLAAAAEELDSASKGRSPLLGILFEELLKTRTQQQQPGLKDVDNSMLSGVLRTFGYQHPATAAFRYSRALVARDLGRPAAAISELEEIVKICRRHFGIDHPRTLTYTLGLAANQSVAGHFGASRQTYNNVLDAAAGADDVAFLSATAHLGLGLLDASEQSYDTAIEHLTGALASFEQIGHLTPESTARAYNGLIWCHLQNDNLAAAKSLLQDARPFMENAAAEVKIPFWSLQLEVAAAQPGDLTDVIRTIAEASDTITVPSTQLKGLYRQLALARSRTHLDDALRGTDSALHTEHHDLNDLAPYLRPQLQISMAATADESLAEATSLSLQFDRQDVHRATATWVINGHNRLPEVLALKRRAQSLISDGETMSTLIRWNGAAADRFRLPLKVDVEQPPENIRATVRELVAAENDLFQQLPENVQALYNNTPEWIDLEQVRAALADDEVLMVIRRSQTPGRILTGGVEQDQREVYVAWLITAQADAPVQVVNLGAKDEIDDEVQRAMRSFAALARRSAESQPARHEILRERKMLQMLSDRLWKPISARVSAGVKRLTVCAGGPLHNLPWSALTADNGEPLLEQFVVRYVSTPRELVTPRPKSGEPPVVISQPDYRLADAAVSRLPRYELQMLVRKAQGSRLDVDRSKLVQSVSVVDSDEDFLDLLDPDTSTADSVLGDLVLANEIRDWTGVAPQYFQLDEASDYRLLTIRPGRVLHISTAGFEDQPRVVTRSPGFLAPGPRALVSAPDIRAFNPLMRCGLLLAGCDISTERNHLADGVWTGEEIATMNLSDTDLVVLNVRPQASSTDYGFGVGTMPHLFRLAGARTVVSQTLPVPVEISQPLLQEFYQAMAAGEAAEDVINRLQRNLRNSLRDDSGFAPVGRWAGFRVTGVLMRAAADEPAEREEASKPSGVGHERPDLSDPRIVAQVVLRRFADKDVAGLLAMSQEGQVPDSEVQKFAPGSVRYKSLFGQSAWRWRAVSRWDGRLPNVFYTRNRKPVDEADANTAHVEFGRSGSEIFVVTLTRQGNIWLFEDIHSPDASDLQPQ